MESNLNLYFIIIIIFIIIILIGYYREYIFTTLGVTNNTNENDILVDSINQKQNN